MINHLIIAASSHTNNGIGGPYTLLYIGLGLLVLSRFFPKGK